MLVLLYRTHLGQSTDLCALERWIAELEKNRNKIWNADKDIVKNFRASEDFFEIVLDGYLVASIIHACGFGESTEFLTNISTVPRETLSKAIEALAEHLAQFKQVAQMKSAPSELRDRPLENMTMFMQQGLTMKNFKRAMRDGDPGRALASLSYYTVWFQASSQNKYTKKR